MSFLKIADYFSDLLKLSAVDNGDGTFTPKVAIDGNVTLNAAAVTVSNEVEIKNDTGNPVPIAGTVLPSEDASQSGKVTGSIAAVGNTVVVPIAAYNGATFAWASGTFAGITLAFEASYDDLTTWVAIQALSVSGGSPVTSIVTTANTAGAYEVYAPGATHVRIRASAWTSGSMSARGIPTVLAQDIAPAIGGGQPTGMPTTTVIGGSAEDAATTANPVIVGGIVRTAVAPATLIAGDAARDTMLPSGGKTVAHAAPWVNTAEVASAARTATGNSGAISTPAGGAISGLINITAVSGTSPTLDLTLEESMDGGTTWVTRWAAHRATAVTTIEIPIMKVGGIRRWAWTIGGTSPSFTFQIATNSLNCDAPIVRSLVDRSINPNTLYSASAVLNVEGCSTLALWVSSGAGATTSPVYQIAISEDGALWTGLGATNITASASGNWMTYITGISAKFVKVSIATAGVAATHNYAVIRAMSK
jgi:hypothetical protein